MIVLGFFSIGVYTFSHIESFDLIALVILPITYFILHVLLNREVFMVNNSLSTSITLPLALPAIIFLNPFVAGLYAAAIEFHLFKKLKKEKIKVVFNICSSGLTLMFLAYFLQEVMVIGQYEVSSPVYLLLLLLAGGSYALLINLLPLVAYTLQFKKIDAHVMNSILSSLRTSGITIFLGVINVFIYYFFGVIGIAISTFIMITIKPLINFQSILDNEMTTFTDFVLHIIKLYDPITHAHSERVKKWTVMIAKEMRLPSKQVHELSQAASWHDIGKIEIPSHIINKTGKLTETEYDLVKAHPEIGYKLVKDMYFFKDYMPIIRYHHERMDGKGYPLGLKGKEIPLHSRIMCVADSFDAMTSKRSYKKGMTMKEAVEELERCSGTQFDPEIVEVFIRALKKTYGSDFNKWDKQVANY